MQRAIVGRGAAYGDIDNDGDLDLLITSNNGPARLLRNENANQNDLLRIKTVGTRANRDGIGAKVTLKTAKGKLFNMVKTARVIVLRASCHSCLVWALRRRAGR